MSDSDPDDRPVTTAATEFDLLEPTGLDEQVKKASDFVPSPSTMYDVGGERLEDVKAAQRKRNVFVILGIALVAGAGAAWFFLGRG